jgi:phosphoglycerate dehydrogenase-like enzyme
VKAVLHYRAGPELRALVAATADRLPVTVVEPGDEAGLARAMADAEILLHVLTPVTAPVMDLAPGLRLIQKIGVGLDTIDLRHAHARGIAVANMPGTNTAAVAEMTLALMLACLRRTVVLSEATKAGRGWDLPVETLDGLGEIGGRTVGLIGYGAIPQRLAPVLRALGATPIAWTRSGGRADGIDALPLDDLLRRSDIVSLHIPSTPETARILDARRLALIRPGGILVNTARGALVDEAALFEALTSGRLAAAGLDVFAAEPARENPLFALPNVVAAPHVAWLTQETLARSMAVVLENARRLTTGEPLLNRVPLP